VAKMGRPKKNKDERLEFAVTAMFNRVQAIRIKAAAAAKGKGASEWARDILLANLPKEI